MRRRVWQIFLAAGLSVFLALKGPFRQPRPKAWVESIIPSALKGPFICTREMNGPFRAEKPRFAVPGLRPGLLERPFQGRKPRAFWLPERFARPVPQGERHESWWKICSPFWFSTPTASFLQPGVEGASPDTLGKPGPIGLRLRRSRSDLHRLERHLRCRIPFALAPGVSLAEPRSTPGCKNDTFGVEEWSR